MPTPRKTKAITRHYTPEEKAALIDQWTLENADRLKELEIIKEPLPRYVHPFDLKTGELKDTALRSNLNKIVPVIKVKRKPVIKREKLKRGTKKELKYMSDETKEWVDIMVGKYPDFSISIFGEVRRNRHLYQLPDGKFTILGKKSIPVFKKEGVDYCNLAALDTEKKHKKMETLYKNAFGTEYADRPKVNELEVWRPVEYKGVENYDVSSFGRVRRKEIVFSDSLNRNYAFYEYILNPKATDSDGYLRVSLRKEKTKQVCMKVHRLVALAFMVPPDPLSTVIWHIDGNKLNNRLDNLKYVTRSFAKTKKALAHD